MSDARACVSRIVEGRREQVIATAGRRNGLAIDGDGDLWIAEAHEGAVLRVDRRGRVKLRIEGDAQGRFAWPNDLAFGPDGMLYLTDSGVRDVDLIADGRICLNFAGLAYDGRLYRIDPVAGRVVDTLDCGFRFTNGLAFGPDGRLYVNETCQGGLRLRPLRVSTLARGVRQRAAGPQRRAVQRAGRNGLRRCGPALLRRLRPGRCGGAVPGGEVVRRIASGGNRPTNVAFHPREAAIYVTEVQTSSVKVFEVPHAGLSLHAPKLG